MIRIDGSMGEGGGQILRSALTLALITGKPFDIQKIRAARPRPGLRPQHLEAVRAAARVGEAQVEGAAENSDFLRFHPRRVTAGRYRFEIRTAGAASLVLQTVALPLALAGESRVEIRGGTHVPWSPTADYLERQWAPWLEKLGIRVRPRLKRAGFYPQGGGELQAEIEPAGKVLPLRALERGALRDVIIRSAACNLPEHIAERQMKRAAERVQGLLPLEPRREMPEIPAFGKGSFLMIHVQYEGGAACYTSLGAIGKAAEKVADEASRELKAFLATDAVMDEHMADQILLPLALSKEASAYTTPAVTQHLLTNADVIRMFLPVDIRVAGALGKPGRVDVEPM